MNEDKRINKWISGKLSWKYENEFDRKKTYWTNKCEKIVKYKQDAFKNECSRQLINIKVEGKKITINCEKILDYPQSLRL